MCFPCSVRNTFFCASHAPKEWHFWNRFDPHGINAIFSRGVISPVAAARCTIQCLDTKYHSRCGERRIFAFLHSCCSQVGPKGPDVQQPPFNACDVFLYFINKIMISLSHHHSFPLLLFFSHYIHKLPINRPCRPILVLLEVYWSCLLYTSPSPRDA